MVDLPEHDETALRGYEWTGVELADPDEALLQFPSERVEHIATPISHDQALPESRSDDGAERRPADDRPATARIVATSVRADLKPTRVYSNVEPREGSRMN
jgi:hypothetical protein